MHAIAKLVSTVGRCKILNFVTGASSDSSKRRQNYEKTSPRCFHSPDFISTIPPSHISGFVQLM